MPFYHHRNAQTPAAMPQPASWLVGQSAAPASAVSPAASSDHTAPHAGQPVDSVTSQSTVPGTVPSAQQTSISRTAPPAAATATRATASMELVQPTMISACFTLDQVGVWVIDTLYSSITQTKYLSLSIVPKTRNDMCIAMKCVQLTTVIKLTEKDSVNCSTIKGALTLSPLRIENCSTLSNFTASSLDPVLHFCDKTVSSRLHLHVGISNHSFMVVADFAWGQKTSTAN